MPSVRTDRCVRFASLLFVALALFSADVRAQRWLHADDDAATNRSMFRPLDDWPDPDAHRAASGAPGPGYWQQHVDYEIETALDTVRHVVTGSERITYHNNSPHTLGYVWVQLDQNVRSREHSRTYAAQEALPEHVSPQFRRYVGLDPFDGGFELTRVQAVGVDGRLADARHVINNTVMKVHLPEALAPGDEAVLEIDWSFSVPDFGRGAKEKVEDGWLYVVAQWYPRLSVFDDVNGWQTDQFLGRGEFYLEFGDFDVRITVPWDHLVDATGVLQNPEEVLTAEQRRRLAAAYEGAEPSFIVRPDEVMTPSSRPVHEGMVTWHFKAEDVRDFAWASSKTFVWDAAGFRYDAGDAPIRMHSLYPRSAMPVWDKVSTRAIAQTLRTYGRMALRYPYPKAVNVNGPVGGMEYPMVAFCGARPRGGQYQPSVERALISVTIHEVGHNWFPMIVASDERKWTWMDEGLNTFLQYYAEQDYAAYYRGTAWTQTDDGTYPSRRGPAPTIVDYMRDPDQVPIMTHSDLIHRGFGANGYAKPATGLMMLRERIVGPELFDEAFREYTRSWAFKHPQPYDFFRSMEEGAGEDLAWFWRGWFYTTHANDQALAAVTVQAADALVGTTTRGRYYYRVEIRNEGGLLMPVDLEVTYDDGTSERMTAPIDVWRNDERSFTKGFFSDRRVARVVLDPDEAFADVDRDDNVWEAAPVTPQGEASGSR